MNIIDEPEAIEEIKGLSENSRQYLQILWRNQLQALLSAMETGRGEKTMRHEIPGMGDSLRRLGL